LETKQTPEPDNLVIPSFHCGYQVERYMCSGTQMVDRNSNSTAEPLSDLSLMYNQIEDE
jgi:hypothetical protein